MRLKGLRMGNFTVPDEIKQYMNIMKKELRNEFDEKISRVKKEVQTKLKVMEDKFINNGINISEKCESFIREKMVIVNDLEKAMEFNNLETTDIKTNMAIMSTKVNKCTDIQEDILPNVAALDLSVKYLNDSVVSTSNDVKGLRNDVDWCHDEIIDSTEYVNSMNERVNEVNRDLVKVESKANHLDGHSRRDQLLVHSLDDIPQNRNEHNMIGYMCFKLNQLLPRKFRITPEHISTAHLITPKDRNNKTPIVVVKFTHRWIRNQFFYDRHFIRDRRVRITEHLCDYRLWLLREARKVFGYQNVYTDQCNVYRLSNRRDIKISNIYDIYRRK